MADKKKSPPSSGNKFHPPAAGSHQIKPKNHGGVDSIKQKPGVHESLRRS
jgi:hypothetical protein